FPPQHLEPPGLETELDPAPSWRAPEYRPAGKLDGKRALITGGDSGIGRAVAYAFAREGADVAITHLESEHPDAETTCKAIAEVGRKALSYELDQRDYEACQRVVEAVVSQLGGIDILVNNGAYQCHCEGIE